jgi:transposase
VLESVGETEAEVIVRVHARETPRCPVCSGSKVSYHSRYQRRLRDLPWSGKTVQIHLCTRRFRCGNKQCRRKIFAECPPGVAAPRARETDRVCELLAMVGYVLGGLPGSRLLDRLGIPNSADTILRRVKTRLRGQGAPPPVRVLGVDDWAWRKQQHYGTMLMDLERQRVVELLPVRSASSFAAWLKAHPEVEIITRDRSGLYADGGRQGAPQAEQITDRYHLVSNLAEAAERDIQQLQSAARTALTQQAAPNKRASQPTLVETRRQRCRQERYNRYLAVIELRRQGHTQLAIAERIGIAADTVACWLNAPRFPERRIRSDRQRDQARFVQNQAFGLHPSVARTHYSAGRVAGLLSRPPRMLSASQKRYLEAFLQFCPKARELRRFVLKFRAILRWRSDKRLSNWVAAVVASTFPFLAQFAKTLSRDWGAVERSITTPWNNGPVEGHINRLKVIKRQMYGRAGFELLKARVLPWVPANST